MIVSIQHIVPGSLMTVPGTSQMGLLVDFESAALSGRAVLVPRGGVSALLRKNQKIKVDLRPEYISQFRLLPAPTLPSVKALSDPDDYSVEGPVIFSHDQGSFGVQVGDCLVTLGEDDALGRRPAAGEWVSFHVHGLSLWEI